MKLAFYPPITKEWAIQLALEAFGKLDFDNLKCIYWPELYSAYHVAILKQVVFTFSNLPAEPSLIEHEEIRLVRFFDRINQEIHLIGYGPKSNTLIVYQPWLSSNAKQPPSSPVAAGF